MIEQYSAPGSVEEATRVMHEGKVTVLAGGTDLMPQSESGKREFGTTLLNIRRIESLHEIDIRDGQVRIGALTTVTEVLEHEELSRIAPVLLQTADRFASSQLRNIATLGGNLCNASPAGDMIIPLLLLDARVELASWSAGTVVCRRIPVVEFFTGPGVTCKQDDELLTAIEFALPESGFVAGFCKSGPRPALEIAMVSLGVAGILKNDALHAVRVAIGAAAPTALRATRVEAALEGRRLDGSLISKAADLAAEAAMPIDDVRASAWYRRHLIRVFASMLLTDVAASPRREQVDESGQDVSLLARHDDQQWQAARKKRQGRLRQQGVADSPNRMRDGVLDIQIEFTLNGRVSRATVPPDMSVLTMLRERFDLTGAKLACGEGECGACTVLVDDDTVNACLMFAVDCDGRQIQTIEGLRKDAELDPMQQAFVTHGAVQCGYCTPGMIMQANYLVQKNPGLSREQIKRNLEGNICRCTGYTKIIDAVADVAGSHKNVSAL